MNEEDEDDDWFYFQWESLQATRIKLVICEKSIEINQFYSQWTIELSVRKYHSNSKYLFPGAFPPGSNCEYSPVYFFRCSSIDTCTIKSYETELYEDMKQKTNGKVPERVYFNKGL